MADDKMNSPVKVTIHGPASVQAVKRLTETGAIDHGHTLVLNFELSGGGSLSLQLPAAILASVMRELWHLGARAEAIRNAGGIPETVVDALTMVGSPSSRTTTDGRVILGLPTRQGFPVSVAIDPAQAEEVIAALTAALGSPGTKSTPH